MGRETKVVTRKSAVSQSIDQIIARALSSGVTTIHIEPTLNFTVVRFRRGSKLSVANKLPASTSKKMTEQLKKLANLDVKRTTNIQSGLAEIKIQNKLHQLQIVSLPVIDGEKITIDIIRDESQMTLENIGLWGNNLKLLQQAMGSSEGLILSVSPQIRPAQDLLAVMLNKLCSSSRSIGYIGQNIPSLSENVVNLGSNSQDALLEATNPGKFATLGVGMISSKAVASQVNNLAGHKQHIIAVLPAKSSINALIVWNQLIPGQTTSPFLVCQYRVNTLCQNCREAYKPTLIEQIQLNEIYHLDISKNLEGLNILEKAALKEGLGLSNELSTSKESIDLLYRRNVLGCSHCEYTGYGSEIGIFEVLDPSEKLTKLISNRQNLDQAKETMQEDGMITLKLDALIKALRGLIDFHCVLQIYAITG